MLWQLVSISANSDRSEPGEWRGTAALSSPPSMTRRELAAGQLRKSAVAGRFGFGGAWMPAPIPPPHRPCPSPRQRLKLGPPSTRRGLAPSRTHDSNCIMPCSSRLHLASRTSSRATMMGRAIRHPGPVGVQRARYGVPRCGRRAWRAARGRVVSIRRALLAASLRHRHACDLRVRPQFVGRALPRRRLLRRAVLLCERAPAARPGAAHGSPQGRGAMTHRRMDRCRAAGLPLGRRRARAGGAGGRLPRLRGRCGAPPADDLVGPEFLHHEAVRLPTAAGECVR